MTAFSHRQPDRVPIWCGMSWAFQEKAKRQLGLDDEGLLVRLGDDFRRVSAEYAGPKFELRNSRANKRTVFGVERSGVGYGQPVNHPLAEAALRDVHEHPWPDPAWMDVSKIRQKTESWGGKYCILGGSWSPFWHDAIELAGMENLYMKMYDEPEFVDAIMAHTVDYYFEVSRRTFEAACGTIDVFFMGNDLGSQTGPLLGPDLFSRFILPHLKRLIQLGHDYGLKTQLHSCGGIAPLIPLLIDTGLDSLQAVQCTCRGMDLAQLKAQFGDKIVFNGAIDSHHMLIDGSIDMVQQATRQTLDIMMPGGGYVAGASHDSILEETPVENILAMTDTVQGYGAYKN
ncbi:MAG: hypothetical protein HZA50_06345 [Planctomycetes bacterium]|nr:hypothetical protein [Planctomycetota bacterium]